MNEKKDCGNCKYIKLIPTYENKCGRCIDTFVENDTFPNWEVK